MSPAGRRSHAGRVRHRPGAGDREEHAMTRLQDKVTVITGGESGIGLATARRFIAEGAKVYILGLDEGRMKDAELELGAACGYSVADVTDETAVSDALQAAVDRFGLLDVLFSNAGISGAVS